MSQISIKDYKSAIVSYKKQEVECRKNADELTGLLIKNHCPKKKGDIIACTDKYKNLGKKIEIKRIYVLTTSNIKSMPIGWLYVGKVINRNGKVNEKNIWGNAEEKFKRNLK